MRSSSLKVYSPVEYTGYKEKRSGHPSEPGSRTGNRKTTRKPKPILYRLRRFCKRLNWKRIGGLAVTTVVIVFAARGVVGMFSEHTQTKTAPVTTSSPAAEESQPHVFYYKDGQAVCWEDVTDAWAAEAGIQKRYALTDAERLEIAQVLTAEAEQYKKSSGEWYQFFTSKDKELRDTQAELQKARKALEAKEGEQNHGNDKESNS